MRHTGIDVVGDVPWGTHFCQFYETSQDLVDILVPYFSEGLAANEFCMWVTSAPLRVEEAKAALREAVPDLDRHIASGQIEFLDYSEWYTRSGAFNSDEVLQGWVDKLVAAQQRGHEGLRLTGNTFWLEQADWGDFTRYEEAVNSVIGNYRMLAVCTYCLPKCSATEIIDVVVNHQFALIKREGRWEIIESAEHKKMEQALRESEEQLKLQTEELQVANEELEVQSEELQTANEELRVREEALLHSEERLRQADRRKDEFLAMLAHELRNPLSAVYNAVQFLRARGSADPALRKARDAAARQAEHMARLLDDLLDVSRITEGKITLRKETVALASVIESAIESASPLVDACQHELYVSMPWEALHLDADPVRLAQVVANLLHNAAKYTPPGGDIRLSACREGDHALIRVRDNGTGIPPELLPSVFDLFVQADRSPARAQGGLGIGLTMVRALVEMHGGCVEARSDGPGKGSEFAVWLPLLPAGPVEPARPSEQEIGVGRPRRILVVDDNADGAEMLAALLQLDGHEVVTADSGPAALELAASYAPDVALIDIGMPGMDGYAVARRLRQQPAVASATLVALTGYGQDEDRERSRQAGFDYHLTKPVNMDAVRRVLLGIPPGPDR